MSQNITFKNVKLSQKANLTQGSTFTSKAGKEITMFYLNGILDPSLNPEHATALRELTSFINNETGGTGESLEHILQKRKAYKRGEDKKRVLDIQGQPQLVEHPTEVSVVFRNFKNPEVSGLEEGMDLENIVLPPYSIVDVEAAIDVTQKDGKTYVNLYMNGVNLVKRGEPSLKKGRGALVK